MSVLSDAASLLCAVCEPMEQHCSSLGHDGSFDCCHKLNPLMVPLMPLTRVRVSSSHTDLRYWTS